MCNNIKQNIWFPLFILFSFLFQSCQPLNTSPSNQTDNLSEIATALKRIQMEGSDKSYAIFFADKQKNYFVQVAGSSNIPLLYTEAVGNQYLESNYKLQANQMDMLNSLGWHSSSKVLKHNSPNYFRKWEASTDNMRLIVANNLLDTLVKVYGFDNSKPIGIKIDLNP